MSNGGESVHRARCRNCGEEIESLDHTETKTVYATVSIVDERLDYETLKIELDDVKYSCPMCEEVVATDEAEAEKILKGTHEE